MYNVAVVTPVYNTQDYLHRCIKSVLGQTGVSLQYFIIDDGSTDNSANIAQHYQKKDARITFVKKSNEGQGVARNIGIKLADAEYIYFVDSDDYLGENALAILYKTAKENALDVCSPNVPKHYFDKALEYISCLPCKSQFVRLEIIRDFGILQPAIRSGQDGVFSHLVLTHCNRIGMATAASFHYTHAREGSTFAAHLTRHDLVPTLLEQHYAAIERHYDMHALWKKNSMRLLGFIADESLKNRLDPHLEHLDIAQKQQCFRTLSLIAKKAYRFLDSNEKASVHPAVAVFATKDIDFLVDRYESDFAGRKFELSRPTSSNIYYEKLIICKFANDKLAPAQRNIEVASLPMEIATSTQKNQSGDSAVGLSIIQSEIRGLRGKLDLAINSINNSAVQLASAIHSPTRTLAAGVSEIVASLTTLPHRLPLVHFAIESIFSQTVLPGKVVLWITDKVDEENCTTPELQALVERGLEIRKVEDVGPHTKLIYALKAFPAKSIITFDDDIVYPINTVQCLWEHHSRNPAAVICNWARELAFDSAGKVKGVRSGKLLSPPLLETEIEQATHFSGIPNLLAFPYGTSGVLYPPNALNPRVFEIDTFKKICPKEDDIWFKAMSLLNKTPVVVTNLGINPAHHCITGSQSEALRHHNHGQNMNNKQMLNVFDEFNLYRFLPNYVISSERSEVRA